MTINCFSVKECPEWDGRTCLCDLRWRERVQINQEAVERNGGAA